MTADPAWTLREASARRWQRVRTAHATTVLRWLRAGVLATVVAAAVLCLVVPAEADHRIAAARRTDRAIADIGTAHDETVAADTALEHAFTTGQVALIGTGTDFANHTARVYSDITSAAQGNAAGQRGLTQLQFVQGQLTTALQLADAAVRDYAHTRSQGRAAPHALLTAAQERYHGQNVPGTGGLTTSLDDLKAIERDALHQQRRSLWLDPACVWPLLVGPAAVMLVLVLVTGRVIARHFRRRLGLALPAALLCTAATGALVSVLAGLDAHDAAAHPLAGHPLILTLALVSLTAAAVLADRAYRPRLAEYRFPRA